MLSGPKIAACIGVDELPGEPERLLRFVHPAQERFGSDDRRLIVAQVAREAISSLTHQAVKLWSEERQLVDLGAANVELTDGPHGVEARFRLPATPIDGAGLAYPRLDADARAPNPSALAVIVWASQQVARCGQRHLQGTAALAAANTLTQLSHTLPHADQDRDELFAAYPHLARTVELLTVDDDLTFAIRRTCCLYYKLPDAMKCGTCSLRDRDPQIATLSDWWRQDRQSARTSPS